MCIRAVDCNPYTTKHVPDQHKTQEMCDKAVDDNPDVLESVPN